MDEARDSEQLQSQLDFSAHGPVMPMSGAIDHPPMPGGPCLAMGTRVRVVGSHTELGGLKHRIGTLARYDKSKDQWWVQFPKFRDSVVRQRLLWDCAFVRPKNLLPLGREEAFDVFKQQLDLAVQSSLRSFAEQEPCASQDMPGIDEVQSSCGGQVVRDVGTEDSFWVAA